MAGKQRFVPKQVLDAIRGSAGIKVVICERLKCSRQTLDNYLERYPELEEAVTLEREARLDLAELLILQNIQIQRKLQQATEEPVDTSDAWKLLDKLGRRRGYGEKIEVNNVDDPVDLMDDDEMFRRFAAIMRRQGSKSKVKKAAQ